MKAWQIRGEYGIDKLQCVELSEPTAGDGQVVVSMRAASLNFRDLVTIRGFPGAKAPAALVPFSDGAGIVQSIGRGVSGPLLITEFSATAVVPPGWVVQRTAHGDLVLERKRDVR